MKLLQYTNYCIRISFSFPFEHFLSAVQQMLAQEGMITKARFGSYKIPWACLWAIVGALETE